MRGTSTIRRAEPRTGSRELSLEALADLQLIWDYLAASDAPAEVDVLFCFGSLDSAVPATAARLYAAGVAPWVLATGGSRGRTDAHGTESEAFGAALEEAGVPRERVIVELRANNTGENVALGMQALVGRGIEVRSTALVAWPLSTRRCIATFARAFPDVRTYSCPSTCDFPPGGRAGRRLVEAALAELHRLRLYPELGYIAAQEIPTAVRHAEERLSALAGIRDDTGAES
jgi:uncharacterized SAM-binding protein YcdF (DUF218 family)